MLIILRAVFDAVRIARSRSEPFGLPDNDEEEPT